MSIVHVNPCTTVQFQGYIDKNPAGTTFMLNPGRFPSGRFLHLKNGTKIISKVPGGAWFDLQQARAGIGYDGATDVTLQDLIIRYGRYPWDGTWPRAQVHCGPRWNIINCELMGGNQVGMSLSDDMVVKGGRVHHQGRYGINGGPGRNLLIDGLELDHNNTFQYNINDDAGGSKFVGADYGTYNFTFRNMHVHDNIGNGLWADWANKDVLYEKNLFENNTGMGIHHECSDAAIIRNNTFRNNASAYTGKDLWWGADIFVYDSHNVQVYGNDIITQANGISGRDDERGSTIFGPLALCNMDVHDNTIVAAGTRLGFVTNRAPLCPTQWTETNNR